MNFVCFYCLTRMVVTRAMRSIMIVEDSLLVPVCNAHFEELQNRTKKTGDKTPE